LIRTIKRNNTTQPQPGTNITNALPDDESAMLDCYRTELGVKKFTKNKMEKILTYLVKNLNETNERQKMLEKKVESLTLQNEGFIIQNQQIIQEVINKNDYTKKLETLLLFILEVIVPKQSYKATPNTAVNNGLISSSNPEFKSKSGTDPFNNIYKAFYEHLGDNFLKNLIEKLFEYGGIPTKEGKISLLPHRGNNLLSAPDNTNTNNIMNPSSMPNKFSQIEEDNKPAFNFKTSPNPYENDFPGFASSIFGSPYNNAMRSDPVDTVMLKKSNDSCNNILNNLSRNSSFDYNEIFKAEGFQKEEENHGIFDDNSYFSISSGERNSKIGNLG
jgi:hypothetical protein